MDANQAAFRNRAIGGPWTQLDANTAPSNLDIHSNPAKPQVRRPSQTVSSYSQGENNQLSATPLSAGLNNWQGGLMELLSSPQQQQYAGATTDYNGLLLQQQLSGNNYNSEQQQGQLDAAASLDAPLDGALSAYLNDSPQLSGSAGAAEFGDEGAGSDIIPALGGSECQDAADSTSGKPVMPVAYLKVSCGDMIGTLLVHRAKIVIHEGTADEKEVSPTEFERLGGRSATKKWKQSIRLVNDDGELGRPVGEWYVQMGLELPKKPREAKDLLMTPIIGPPSPETDRYDTNGSNGAAPAGSKRPVRASARQAGAWLGASSKAEAAAEAAAAKNFTRSSMRQGRPGRQGAAKKGAAAAAAGDDSGSGSAGSAAMLPAAAAFSPVNVHDSGYLPSQYSADPTAAAPAGVPANVSWIGSMGSVSGPPRHEQLPAAGMGSFAAPAPAVPPASTAAATADEMADAAAIRDWQTPGQTAAPLPLGVYGGATAGMQQQSQGLGGLLGSVGPLPVLVPVPAAQPLPGDQSQAVVEMMAYLQRHRACPPWRLLPAMQRPVVGQLLVPLRELFILVLQAGGYTMTQDELMVWQHIATKLQLPAWPTADVPDPLRALQQVYKDYLLRFEGRFTIATNTGSSATSAGPAAAMPAYAQQPQQAGIAAVPAAIAAMPGSSLSLYSMLPSATQAGISLSVPAAAAGQHLQSSSPSSSSAQQQAGSGQAANGQIPSLQRLTSNLSAAGVDAMLQDTLSGDLLQLLTDLIPDNSTAMLPPLLAIPPAAATGEAAGNTAAAVGSGTGTAAPPDTSMLRLAQSAVTAAVTGTAGELSGKGGVTRQHPEMSVLQRRQRLQQLQQHLKQQQQLVAEQCAGAARTGQADTAAGGANIGGARSKRPPPLVRCGDSDVLSLMDQAEVARLLQEHDLHQQRLAAADAQGHIGNGADAASNSGATGTSIGPSASAAAAGTPAADDVARDMSQDLHALLQEYYQLPGAESSQQQQQPPAQGALGQPYPVIEQPPEQEGTEEVMSGMLGALHIEGQQQPQQPDNSSKEDWAGQLLSGSKLFVQGSVGARLVDLTTPAGASNSNSFVTPPAAVPGRQQQQGQGQQQQQDDLVLSSFQDNLLRLTTPSSLLIGSVLDSPTFKDSNTGWLDIGGAQSVPRLLSADFRDLSTDCRGMSADLRGVVSQLGVGDGIVGASNRAGDDSFDIGAMMP